MSLKEQIKEAARAIGYHACGITGVEPFGDYLASLRELAARFPESADLYRRMERRSSPTGLNPWARSIVVCIRRYGKYTVPEELARHIGRTYLCDRRIATCPDTTMPSRMKETLKGLGMRVRTGGVPCREAALRAGLVRIGRNGFAYAEGAGSWINIEAWMVNAEIEPDPPAPKHAPCPDGCNACQSSCRTQALTGPYVMDMKRCIAYLSYEAPLPGPQELLSKMGPWIYGCDDCQNCCPMNKGQWARLDPTPWLDAVTEQLTPAALASMDQDTYSRVVYPLFNYISPDNLARWHANAERVRACE